MSLSYAERGQRTIPSVRRPVAWASGVSILFNSNLFLFAFLPIVLSGFLFLCRVGTAFHIQVWLAVASIVFYAWSGIEFLPILIVSIAANYMFGRAIALETRARRRSWILATGIAFDLLLLGYFKYAGFFARSVEAMTGLGVPIPDVTLPVGISFYTFTQIAFLVDASRGQAKEYDIARYGLFVTFFPHLIAGPIIHHKEMMPQFQKLSVGDRLWENIASGTLIFAIGLAKKCLIADPLGSFCSPIFERAVNDQDIHFFIAWAGAFAYTFQIYFDFSGYSDMAIGLARMFGVKFPANFNSPYKSRNIIEFWRRWHMTLSRFLRDYLYVPLGGNRKGPVRRYVNLWLVMLIGGLWHGAAWTFVLWGALHGTYLVIAHGWGYLSGRGFVPRRTGALVGYMAPGITFLAVVVAWVTFRATSFDAAKNLYEAMFLLRGLSLPLEFERLFDAAGLQSGSILFFAENSRMEFYLGLAMTLFAACIAFLAPNSLQLTAAFEPTTDFDAVKATWDAREPQVRKRLWSVDLANRKHALGTGAALSAGVMFFLALRAINSAAETEFLYFQF